MLRRLPLVLLTLGLAACDREAEAPDADLQGLAPAAGPDSSGAAPPAVEGAACLVGTWAVDAEASYRPEPWAGLAPGGDVAFEYGGASGRALLTFTADGSARQRYEAFALTLYGDTAAGEMSATVRFDGTADGRYTAEGGRLHLAPGDAALTSRAQVSVGGREVSRGEVDVESLFESGPGSLLTFTCRGDELLLDARANPDSSRILFEDARYTRVGP